MITSEGKQLITDVMLGEASFPTSLWVGLCLDYPVGLPGFGEPTAPDYERQEILMDPLKWDVSDGFMSYKDWIQWTPPAIDWGVEGTDTICYGIVCDASTAGNALFAEAVQAVFPGAGTPLSIAPYGLRITVVA